MAYAVEQDRVRAILPEGSISLRPVLRINTEIRTGEGSSDTDAGSHAPAGDPGTDRTSAGITESQTVYIEFNAPAERDGKRGWINIANWSSRTDDITAEREAEKVTIRAPFFELAYKGVGIEGGCPAEKDNDGCFFRDTDGSFIFRPAEKIDSNKEFCDCEFTWKFNDGDAHGVSRGKTIPAFFEESSRQYARQAFTAENAAAIPCRQVLGSYIVRFTRP